ncbi:hypothetical protein Patl1_32386 [Pistacia atlantica]|uniref:Uncharacterized protein n=1 Tax=Pistacia atlantica TaxID=434234 RepID=A0ACC1AQJ3_9ROSI|nr:hypothetical protein Patl1_32386 [Pistacia atlantica]
MLQSRAFGLVLDFYVSCLLVLQKESALASFRRFRNLVLLFLGASFFSNSILQRNKDEKKREFKLKEEDILRFGRLILPATNLAISKTRSFLRRAISDPQSSSIFASRS